MKKNRGPYKDNVVSIEDAKKTVDVRLRCTICNRVYNELVKATMDLNRLRCPKCVNQVDLVYPGEDL